jgi:hypothetical protein
MLIKRHSNIRINHFLLFKGAADNTVTAKLNLNCPLGIFLSYSLQTLRVELDKKVKEVNEQADQIVPIIPPDTSEEQMEGVANAAKEAAATEKDKLHDLAAKLGDIGVKMAASTAHNIELLDESNGLVQCQEVCTCVLHIWQCCNKAAPIDFLLLIVNFTKSHILSVFFLIKISLQNIKLNASEVLKPFGKYTIGILQESETEPPSVLPLMVGASAVALKKGK